jgi:hypothetical protein
MASLSSLTAGRRACQTPQLARRQDFSGRWQGVNGGLARVLPFVGRPMLSDADSR